MAFQEALLAGIGVQRGANAADTLCVTCADLLDVDAVAISLIFNGANSGTMGASGEQARLYDELQFTLGEGPCLESVASRAPVLVPDLADPSETRWPGYNQAMLQHSVRGVYAVPVAIAGEYVGALDLFWRTPGVLSEEQLRHALLAAEVAAMPLLDLLSNDLLAAASDIDSDGWSELAQLARTEVSQATGMLIAQLEIDAAAALVILRAHAYATNRSATSVARDILENRLHLGDDT